MVVLLEDFDGSAQNAKPFRKCGAALISSDWVITASHCIGDSEEARLSVIVGPFSLVNWFNESYTYNGITYTPEWRPVDQIHSYPQVATNTTGVFYLPDAAMLHLDAPVSLPYINLPTEQSQPQANGLVLGWGSLTTRPKNAVYPDELHEVELPIVDDELCDAVFEEISEDVEFVHEYELCAGYESGGKDACFGDSGGPMVLRNADPEHGSTVLCGIVSYGVSPCGTTGTYGAYTDVYSILPFIDALLNNESYAHLGDTPAPTVIPSPSPTRLPTASPLSS